MEDQSRTRDGSSRDAHHEGMHGGRQRQCGRARTSDRSAVLTRSHRVRPCDRIGLARTTEQAQTPGTRNGRGTTMELQFTEESAPVYRRPVDENPFTEIVNAM